MAAMTPSELFDRVLSSQPSLPFVTFYDEATGERGELSAKSLANWVAKTHFLLQDGLGLGPGCVAQVALRSDWLRVAVLLGSWSAGLSISAPGAGNRPDVAFVEPQTLADGLDAAEILAVNPLSLSRSFGGQPPKGSEDFVASARPQPDAWGSVRSAASADAPCIAELTGAEVLDRGATRVAALGLDAGARLLYSVPGEAAAASPEHWIDLVVLPLMLGGSVVYVANGDAATLTRRCEQERAQLIS
ncbi:TIGR03089 family protein [Frankineae bacterium MT45]|nr:TIGR03089 family protein [Frankineae bacterium MT45]